MHPSQGLGNSAASRSQNDPRRPGASRVESARPGTSFGQSHPQGQQAHHPQYAPQYGDHFGVGRQYGVVEEGYEEESEDEDVFAFLPPSTAEAAKERESSVPVGGRMLFQRTSDLKTKCKVLFLICVSFCTKKEGLFPFLNNCRFLVSSR